MGVLLSRQNTGKVSTVPTNRPTAAAARDRVALYGAPESTDHDLLTACLAPAVVDAITQAGGLASVVQGHPVEAKHRTAVAAFHELARRLAALELPYATAIRGPDDLTRFARARWGAEPVEVFSVIGLDARGRVKLVREVARGSVSHVDTHPREVFCPAVEARVHSVIVVHNHPSGEPEPSQADLELTRRLAECGRLLGVPLLDHVVVTRTRSVSLASMGVLPGQ